jgi:hypothetical protein
LKESTLVRAKHDTDLLPDCPIFVSSLLLGSPRDVENRQQAKRPLRRVRVRDGRVIYESGEGGENKR